LANFAYGLKQDVFESNGSILELQLRASVVQDLMLCRLVGFHW